MMNLKPCPFYKLGCRCPKCLAAKPPKRAHNPVVHGTRSMYCYGCRCEACRVASRVGCRADYLRRRAQQIARMEV